MNRPRSNTQSPTRTPSPTASAFAHQRLDADHVAAMLTRLVRRERRRVEASA
jgi:hypothetical protein